MKKAGFLLFLVALFGVCLWLGFQAAVQGVAIGDGLAGNPTATAGNTQYNLLIVSVDSLETPTPQLISVWVLFTVSAEPSPSLMFLPVYHRDGRYPNAMSLGGTFGLTDTGKPTDAFQSAVLTYLDITQIDNFVTLDQQAVSAFANTFPANLPSPQPYQVTTIDETTLIQNMCATLESKSSDTSINMDWNQIVPVHFRTEMSFSYFTGSWRKFTQSASPPHCEVIQK
jgi:hypothetical protein